MSVDRNLPAVAVLLLLAACSLPTPPAAPRSTGVPVTTAVVRAAPAFEDIPVSGLLASETEARLSFKTGGIIQKISEKEGDTVTTGSLLATLNLTEIHAQVDQANEALLKAGRDLDRVKSLFAASVATQEQVDNAKTAYQLALRTREIAGYNLGFSEIRAAGPGVVVKKLMNEGELAGPGTPVFLLSGSAAVDWVLRCGLSDVQWAKTTLGDKALVTLDAYPGTTWAAVVSRRSSAAEPGTGLYRVDLQVLPGPHPLAVGLFGQGRLRVKASPGAWEVPVESVLHMKEGRGTVLLSWQGKVEPRPVTVVRWNTDTLVVSGDLNRGDLVVDRGAAYVAGTGGLQP